MKYTLELEQRDVQVIIDALGELPLKKAANTYAVIQAQVMKQDEQNAIDLQAIEQQGQGGQRA